MALTQPETIALDTEKALSSHSTLELSSALNSKSKDDKLVLSKLFDDMEELNLKMKKYKERNTELEVLSNFKNGSLVEQGFRYDHDAERSMLAD
jgi:hypothetical protein